MSRYPHIVEIITHDLGQHLSIYGRNSIGTPNLDGLGRDGAVLSSMFAVAPQCSPSRSAIMTGRYPHSNGMFGLAHRGWGYHPGERTLPMRLREYGYRSHLIGFHHECPHGSPTETAARLGYDAVRDFEAPVYAASTVDRMCGYIASDVSPDTPTFLSIGFFDVHRPNYGPIPHADAVSLPAYIPDTPDTRADYAQFEQMVSSFDAHIGQLLQTIDRTLPPEDTIVFFTTDHGPEFNRAKMTLYDPGLLSSFLVRWSGRIDAGTVLDGMYSNVDVKPTLLELAGIPIPPDIHGRSFARDLLAGRGDGRDWLIAEKTYHAYRDPMRAIRTRRYKLIRNMRSGFPIQVSAEHCERMGWSFAEALYGTGRPETELYDLDRDPLEMRNLAEEPAYRGTVATLRDQLVEILRETGDPIVDGVVPEPSFDAGPTLTWVQREGRYHLETA